MTQREARQRLALAGRELGGGPAQAILRITPDSATTEYERIRRGWEILPVCMREEFDEGKAKMLAGRFAYGVAVGLLMAEQPDALATLDEISREWSQNA